MMEESKKPLSFPQRVARFFRILWFQYQIASATYMMEDWEARIYNTVVLIIFCTACYTTYLYLPSHITMIVTYVGYLFGSSEGGTADGAGVVDQTTAS